MGDQPIAIDALSNGIDKNIKYQTLLGVTGSGKTFSMAGIIENTQKPTLVIAHNKTLAAQLATEFQDFFLIILSNTLFHIMITINLKHIFLEQILL